MKKYKIVFFIIVFFLRENNNASNNASNDKKILPQYVELIQNYTNAVKNFENLTHDSRKNALFSGILLYANNLFLRRLISFRHINQGAHWCDNMIKGGIVFFSGDSMIGFAHAYKKKQEINFQNTVMQDVIQKDLENFKIAHNIAHHNVYPETFSEKEKLSYQALLKNINHKDIIENSLENFFRPDIKLLLGSNPFLKFVINYGICEYLPEQATNYYFASGVKDPNAFKDNIESFDNTKDIVSLNQFNNKLIMLGLDRIK